MANHSINLLRSSQNHFWDKFMKWALTTGRFLIILTETIALMAFAYRFTLDRQIIDLGDSIKQNQAIVNLYEELEAEYRNIHERIAYAEELSTPEDEKTALLKQFIRLAQGKVTFQKIAVTPENVTVEATSLSTGGLAAFLSGVKELPEIKSVSVDRIENRPASGTIVVAITAELTNTAASDDEDDEEDTDERN